MLNPSGMRSFTAAAVLRNDILKPATNDPNFRYKVC